MDNKKAFIRGLGMGSLITAIIVLITVAGINVYAKQVLWRGIDPNTKIIEMYNLINTYSIVPFDKDEMLENMYRGFVDAVGDPYTQYFDVDALEAFHSRTDGTFVGIGVMVVTEPDDPFCTIVSTFKDAPADLAGILPDDKIIGVDGTDVAGRTIEDVVGMVTGPEGTVVVLSIYRPFEDERFDVEITRAKVEVPTVFSEVHHAETGVVGYIRIEGFDGVTTGQFETALSELHDEGMDGLILDLRNNPGGLLRSVNEITNKLIPEGIITYTVDSRGRRENFESDEDYLGLPLVVLVNGRSASASEVLSGAIRDTEMGTLVGTQTFGKGVVQNLLELSDGTAIKLTVQTYYTPNGESIHGIGIEPHIIVEMSDDLSRRVGRLTLEEDIQLQTALEIIIEKL